MEHGIRGVFCAAATPVTVDGKPHFQLFSRHCKALLDAGCHGLAILGTTGEANSFSIAQRKALVEVAIADGVSADNLLPGTSTPSVEDTVELTGHAVSAGVRGCLLLPPYYYKGVSDEGLYRFYSRVIESVADDRLRVVLYHIPQVSQIPISHELIERLLSSFPGIVTNLKDSSGDLEHMQSLCARFPDLGVLAGADPLMLPLLKSGGAGCITAAANLIPQTLRTIWDGWNDPARAADVEAAQAETNDWRNLSNRYVQLPSIKAMLAHIHKEPDWLNVMPPLVSLDEAQRQDVWSDMDELMENSLNRASD